MIKLAIQDRKVWKIIIIKDNLMYEEKNEKQLKKLEKYDNSILLFIYVNSLYYRIMV